MLNGVEYVVFDLDEPDEALFSLTDWAHKLKLQEEAATPGGIAAATMAEMDRAGYPRAVVRGIQAGVRRAKDNARSPKS